MSNDRTEGAPARGPGEPRRDASVGDSAHWLKAACRVLGAGGVVCFPTETYYGLAVDPFAAKALERLWAIKARDPDKPVALIAGDLATAKTLWHSVSPRFERLARLYWPGPLTLVAPASERVAPALQNQDGEVGVRVSSHPAARALAQAFGPITATSANRAAQAPARTLAQALALGSDVDLFLDGGELVGGPPSTVVRQAPEGALVVVRQGAIVIS